MGDCTDLACHAVSCALICAVALGSIGDSRDLGLIDPNQPASPATSAGYIDILLDPVQVPLGTVAKEIGALFPSPFVNEYTRTFNDPLGGNYPAAEFAADLGRPVRRILTLAVVSVPSCEI